MLLPLILTCGFDVVTTLEFLIIHVEFWQMLMPMPFFVADGIAIYVEDGKPHFYVLCLADVIAMVADGTAT